GAAQLLSRRLPLDDPHFAVLLGSRGDTGHASDGRPDGLPGLRFDWSLSDELERRDGHRPRPLVVGVEQHCFDAPNLVFVGPPYPALDTIYLVVRYPPDIVAHIPTDHRLIEGSSRGCGGWRGWLPCVSDPRQPGIAAPERVDDRCEDFVD